jgi:hypothetical protein
MLGDSAQGWIYPESIDPQLLQKIELVNPGGAAVEPSTAIILNQEREVWNAHHSIVDHL